LYRVQLVDKPQPPEPVQAKFEGRLAGLRSDVWQYLTPEAVTYLPIEGSVLPLADCRPTG